MKTDSHDAISRTLMSSPTMERIAMMAAECQLDLTQPDVMKSALAMTSHALIMAMDAGEIRFAKEHDRAALHGLLMTVMEVIYEGQFGARVVSTAVH